MKPRIVNRTVMMSGGLCTLLVMPGCMIDRIYSMRAQMCGEEDAVQISEGDGVRVSFVQPTILDTDVKWLSSVQPQSEVVTDDSLTMRYVVSKSGATGADEFSIPIEFGFQAIGGEYKLAQVDVATDLPFAFEPERVERMTAAACENGFNPFRRQIELQLAPEDIADLPDRNDVYTLVGPPHQANDDGTKLRYEFSIAGSEGETGLAVVNLEYDQSGTQLLSMTSSYERFSFTADFQSGKAHTSFSM